MSEPTTHLTEDRIAGLLRAAEDTLRPYATPDGRAVFDVSAHIATVERAGFR